MKRRELLAGMAGLGAVACAGPAVAEPAPISKPFRIYMALYRGWEECAQGFKDYFTNQGIPVELIVRDAGQDKSKLPGFVAEARQLGVDLVFTWGTTVTQEMLGAYDKADPARHITDIPAVFAIVSQPVGAKVVPNLSSSGRNITGTSYLVPVETQVALIQSYRPFTVLGMVYNPLEPNSQVTIDEFTKLGQQQGFRLVAVPVEVVEGKPLPASIPAKVAEVKAAGANFLYIPPDTFINVNRDILTGAALEQKLPSFAAAENPVVASKAMFGGVYRYYTVGQLTAYKAEQILVQKKAPADIPIDAPKRLSIMINMPVVRALGFYPPMNLLGLAEVIDPEVRP
jgi:putative ABC transport system substrate-binding protein